CAREPLVETGGCGSSLAKDQFHRRDRDDLVLAWLCFGFRSFIADGAAPVSDHQQIKVGSCFQVREKKMVRIFVEPAAAGHDLPGSFIKALNILNQNGIKPRSGTKLVSKYAVIVTEDPLKVLEHLGSANIDAFVER